MSEVKLTSDEAAVLKSVLAKLAIRQRTGEVGIMHGADRFVSSQNILSKQERESLKAVANKVGLKGLTEAN
jgi:hypothetical protein